MELGQKPTLGPCGKRTERTLHKRVFHSSRLMTHRRGRSSDRILLMMGNPVVNLLFRCRINTMSPERVPASCGGEQQKRVRPSLEDKFDSKPATRRTETTRGGATSLLFQKTRLRPKPSHKSPQPQCRFRGALSWPRNARRAALGTR